MISPESRSEITTQVEAMNRLDPGLNKALELPRKTQHDWYLVSMYENTSWEDFYAGHLGQVAVTAISKQAVILGQLRWPSRRTGFGIGGVNPFKPTAFFRLAGFEPTAEELFEHRHESPGYLKIGMPFFDLKGYDQLMSQLSLGEISVAED